MNYLSTFSFITCGQQESLGFEFCKMNGCFEAETNICAGDNYRLVADICVRDGDRRPLLAEKGTDCELAHDGSKTEQLSDAKRIFPQHTQLP